MAEEHVIFSTQNHLGLITLNRPQALNALTLSMIEILNCQLELWQEDPDIHAVVITAAPGKAFCAGGDVRWLYHAGLERDQQQRQFFEQEYRLNYLIHQYKKPYIALMDGITMGGGVGIALHGSHPIGSEGFVFAMPETSIGFFPDIGASYLLSRCRNAMGIYLGLTGERLNIAEAQELGLIKHGISANNFEKVITALSEIDLTEDAYVRVSKCLQRFALPLSELPLNDIPTDLCQVFQQPTVESIFEVLQSQSTPWHIKILENLKQKSPLSLKVTLQQLQRAAALNLKQCLEMDYRLVKHFMTDHDFYEGVRARLIDKDNLPQWQPASLEGVTPEKVAQYFESSAISFQF